MVTEQKVAAARLEDLFAQYFDALGAGLPGELPLAGNLCFTENGQVLPFGKGLWVTAESAGARRAAVVVDELEGQIAGWGFAREAGEDILLARAISRGCASGGRQRSPGCSRSAKELGGDGIIGVLLKERRLDKEYRREFSLTGSAVRARGNSHVAQPFATTLNGEDVTTLLVSGYCPAGLVIAVAAAMRHNDSATVNARRLSAGNVEVRGLAELMTGVGAALRDEIVRQTAARGADGSVLASGPTVELGVPECDHVAEAMAVANAIVAFSSSAVAPRRPATILALG